MMIIMIGLLWVKKAARKANRCEASKTCRFHSTVAFQQLGLNYRDTSTAQYRA